MIIVEQLMAYYILYIYIVLDSVLSAVVVIIYVYLYFNVGVLASYIFRHYSWLQMVFSQRLHFLH